jgi:hypothetical protein
MQIARIESTYKVSPANLYHCGFSFTSQPLNYVGTLLLFHANMVIYFVFTVKLNGKDIVAATAVLYAVTTILQLAFPFVDPGVIPGIL